MYLTNIVCLFHLYLITAEIVDYLPLRIPDECLYNIKTVPSLQCLKRFSLCLLQIIKIPLTNQLMSDELEHIFCVKGIRIFLK